LGERRIRFRETSSLPSDLYVRAVEQLQQLRSFRGDPGEFWYSLLRVITLMSEAASGAIFARKLNNDGAMGGDGSIGSDGSAGGDGPWGVLAIAPQSLKGGDYAAELSTRLEPVREQWLRDRVVQWQHNGEQLAVLRFDTGEQSELCLAVLVIDARAQSSPDELARRLLLAADLPAAYQIFRVATEARTKVEHIAGVLDLLVQLNERKRFLAAAMTFCNELAARVRCERVSLGWLERTYIRLRATSHVDRFDRKSDAVRLLEAAMEEALDQNCEVTWPEELGSGPVRRDHKTFARANDAGHMISLPLRIDDKPVAVCTCERTAATFSENEMRMLRLFCEQSARRLSDLKARDRWFGARFASTLREGLGKLLGFEHTALKLLGVIIAALLIFLFFGKLPYRVTAPVTLKTDDIAIVSAPYSGHIQKVDVRVGDTINKGQELLELDKTDLLLSEAQIVAERESYRREAEKAQASYSLADMRIAQAREAQATARLDLVKHHLSQAAITAPFDGVVVEGDLIGHVGLPVNQGDQLFKIARIDKLYASLDVSEQDIREIASVKAGEMALSGRPEQASPLAITRVEPEAISKNHGNVFHVDCNFPNGVESWWRPGMTGVAKLDVGNRTPFWLLTHRTVDFLRLKLWW